MSEAVADSFVSSLQRSGLPFEGEHVARPNPARAITDSMPGMPSRSGVMQAITFGTPSIITWQSLHRPAKQKPPRGRPVRGMVRNTRTPFANNAAASTSPARPESGRPSKVNRTVTASC